MTDPVLALVVIAIFLAVMAAAHYFKTLDADLWHAWRTPIAGGVVAGAMLWPFGAHAVAAGLVLSAAALYVRLMGRESEAVDGMLLGGMVTASASYGPGLRDRRRGDITRSKPARGAVADPDFHLPPARIKMYCRRSALCQSLE